MASLPPLELAQAIVDRLGPEIVIRSRSSNCREAWDREFERIALGFGDRTANVACPEALLALPFAADQVAIVHVRDHDGSSLRFHFRLMHEQLYRHLGDPFAIAQRFPPQWDTKTPLEVVYWPEEPLPPRTVEQLQRITQQGDGPLLYGATQALVDHSRIALQRPEPQPKLLSDIWQLLPDSTRRERWPATFAFCNELAFDLVVLPSLSPEAMEGYLTEEQTLDYPESRYERALQVAIESGDQHELERLLARRSSSETLRLAIQILVLFVLVSVGVRLLSLLG